MKDEEVNKCEFCGEIKSVSRYYIRIKNKHFDDNKKGKYSTYISYCNDCGIEPMLSSKHHSYLTDRVKEKIQEIKKGVRVDLDNIIENLEGYNEADNKMPYEDVLFTQINSYFQAVLVKVEAFLTESIQQSMEVGEKEGYNKGYNEGVSLIEKAKVSFAKLVEEEIINKDTHQTLKKREAQRQKLHNLLSPKL